MSDSEDEPITREKKPLSEARLAAIEKMKEGRKRSLEAKRKLKEEEKLAKKEMKKKIKMKVEEEMNGISTLPLDDKEFMEELKQKAVSPTEVIKEVIVDETKNVEAVIDDYEVVEEPKEVNIVGKPLPKKRASPKKKKKVVVNNYYDEESSEEEEEIVNNYHRKRKPKKVVKKVVVESSEEEEEEEELDYGDEGGMSFVDTPPQQLYRHTPSGMSGIRFC